MSFKTQTCNNTFSYATACAFPFSCRSFFRSSATPSYPLRYRLRSLQRTRYSTVIRVLFMYILTGVSWAQWIPFMSPYGPLYTYWPLHQTQDQTQLKSITNVLLRESLCWLYITIFPKYWDLSKCALGCKLLEGMKHIHIFPQNSTTAGTTGRRWYSFTTQGLYTCTN